MNRYTIKGIKIENVKFAKGSGQGVNHKFFDSTLVLDIIRKELAKYVKNGECHCIINDVKVDVCNDRLACFVENGTSCFFCGKEIVYASIEEAKGRQGRKLINFYMKDRDGQLIIATVDHIKCRSLVNGGGNSVLNYKTSCQCCNANKADTLDDSPKFKKQYERNSKIVSIVNKILNRVTKTNDFELKYMFPKIDPVYRHQKM